MTLWWHFPSCILGFLRVVVPLGLDFILCVGTLWVSILLGFLDIREYLWLCDFDILFGTWDYLLSVVGVGHLGPTQLGGTFFSLLPFEIHLRTPWLELYLLAFIFTLFMYQYERWLHLWCMYHFLWWMSFFYNDWMYHVIMDGFIYLVSFVSWWMMYATLIYVLFFWAFHTLWHVLWMNGHSELIHQKAFGTYVYCCLMTLYFIIILLSGCGYRWT